MAGLDRLWPRRSRGRYSALVAMQRPTEDVTHCRCRENRRYWICLDHLTNRLSSIGDSVNRVPVSTFESRAGLACLSF